MRPCNDQIVVKPMKAKERSEGGILIPESAQAKERPVKGTVLQVGPGAINQFTGNRLPMPCKEGDTVLFGKFSGVEIDDDVRIMQAHEILAVC